jgi:hypothetical protein
MEKALVKKSDILKVKYKFFINRIVAYFSFLLIPLCIQTSLQINLAIQSLVLLMYMLFMGGQWYLLGKEIDHRFGIYYRANSSMDRILYRVVLGNIFVIIFFNLVALVPESLTQYIFWGFYGALGIFYSWPTRGKIIEESMTGQFSEFRFLDSFEKTVLFLTVIISLSSLPEIPLFENIEALKFYFDPSEKIHIGIWKFLKINYLPFNAYPQLYNLAWSYHFFFNGLAIFLLAFYALSRFFLSRRLSILAIFSIVSTWSLSKIVGSSIVLAYTTTFLVLWVWSFLWTVKSSTYRSGLFTGLVLSFGAMLNIHYIFLLPITLSSIYYVFLTHETSWYRKQWLKYNILGVVVTFVVSVTHFEMGKMFSGVSFSYLWDLALELISRKAFYNLSIFGVFLIVCYKLKLFKKHLSFVNFDKERLDQLLFCLVVIIISGLTFSKVYLEGFSLLWIIGFLSLIPLEWIFQSISRLRSKRNIIYTFYILVCLLDSH